MQVKIIYFSQTGNTHRVAKVMAETFRQEHHYVRLIALQDADVDDVDSGDLMGIGTPCFTSRAPQPVMQFLDHLPAMKNHKAFVFATCGGAPGRVLSDMANALHRKGCAVLAGHICRGEVHHPAPSLNGRFPGRPNVEDLNQVRDFARVISERLINHSATHPKNNFPRIKNKWGFYDFLGTLISDPFIRFFMPAPKLNLQNCDLCGFCSLECPTKNIYLEPHPILKDGCIRCYHCYNRCKRDAFELNWQLGNPFLWLLYNQVFERWFGDIQPGEAIYGTGC